MQVEALGNLDLLISDCRLGILDFLMIAKLLHKDEERHVEASDLLILEIRYLKEFGIWIGDFKWVM